MFRQLASLAIVGIALAGCGLARSSQISQMSPDELRSVSDDHLCNPYVKQSSAVTSERSRRNLGDCSHAHLTCMKSGYQQGTALYLQCRQFVAMEESASRQRYANMGTAGQQMMQQGRQQPSPASNTTVYNMQGRTIICTRSGSFVSCQ